MTKPSALIYLDYNATAPLNPVVKETLFKIYDRIGNASSVHQFGRQAQRHVEEARETLKTLLHAPSAELIFTSGGTEANNQVLQHFERLNGEIFISALEHDAVKSAVTSPYVIPVDPQGLLDLRALRKLLEARDVSRPALVSVILANNETGVIQPLKEISEITKEMGVKLHTDAVQAVGRLEVDFEALGVDYMTFSAHKMGGPVGVGAILVRKGQDVSPLIRGGGQEKYRRAGTLNTPGIVGFAMALQEARKRDWKKVEKLRDLLEHEITTFCPAAQIMSEGAPRLSNTSSLRMPGVKNETQVISFDLEGIAVSAGAACSSGKVKNSALLESMGVSPEIASETLRISLGPETEATDIQRFIEIWKTIYQRAHSQQEKAQRNKRENL